MNTKLTLETVTPLFLGGADPRGQPELRGASVRGALRFWLRALLGGVLGDSNLDALRQAESAVFGSTDTGASSVVVRLTGEYQAQAYRPLLHNPTKTFSFQGIMPDKTLTLSLAARQPHRTIPEAAFAALVMFVLFGGLGKRSRRGFGTFAVRSVGNGIPLPLPDYSNAEGFVKQLPLLINHAKKTAESLVNTLGLRAGTSSNPPSFAILHEQHSKVLVCKKSFPGWEVAMRSFWNLLRSDSYRNNSVFGFAGDTGRQASPLHLRIVKLGGIYHILLTAFRVRFASQGQSWEVMQRFLNECKQKWDGDWAYGGDERW